MPSDRIDPLPDSVGTVLSPTDMVEGTDVTLRMLQHWVASDAVWPATVHRSPARRYNQWTLSDRDRLIVVAQVLEDLGELGCGEGADRVRSSPVVVAAGGGPDRHRRPVLRSGHHRLGC